MANKKPCILITGASGLGKTTLAKHLSSHYKIPYVKVSMLDNICRCHDDKIKTHQDLINYQRLNPQAGFKMQYELLMSRQIAFGNHLQSGFITDRGHVDSIVYTWLQVMAYLGDSPRLVELGTKFINKARSIHRIFTHIIYLPLPESWEIEDNNVRVADIEYQKGVDKQFLEILEPFIINKADLDDGYEFGPKVMVLGESNFENRVKESIEFIG